MTGRFARSQIRKRRVSFFHKHWRLIGVVALSLFGIGILLSVVFPDVQIPLAVAVPSALVLTICVAAELFDGTYHLSMAADAEGWTSKELRKALGPDWKVIDWIAFEFSDVDHVIIGPGGVFAVETKYTDSSIDLSSPKGQRWAWRHVEQSIEGARSVRHLLGWHKCDVRSVVVVWGSEVTGSPITLDGVPVVAGRDLSTFLTSWQQSENIISAEDVARLEQQLVRHRQMRLEYEKKSA